MKEILSKIKDIIIFLLVLFITVFIATSIQGESNPLKIAIYVTSAFASFYVIIAIIFMVFNYITEKNVQINKLSKVDFINNKELYREILKDYSPVMLSFIDQMKYDYDTAIVSGLLSLKNKGYIETKENKIEIIKYDFYKLNLPERYIIENIRNGKVHISKNDNNLKDIIFEEGKNKGLLVLNKNWMEIFKKNAKKLICCIIIIIILVILFLNLTGQQYAINLMFSRTISIIFVLGWIYISFYTINYQKNPYSRTKNAKELNDKLEGLKNYLKEYSLLKNRKSEEIYLWKDYLIYSVIFKQNSDIIAEYRKYYVD